MPRRRAGAIGLSHLRVTVEGEFYVGPGRADLIELIAETGSISEAAKRMRMSYKRAWSLVQELNAGFGAPLVEAARGGAAQGGAPVLKAYASPLPDITFCPTGGIDLEKAKQYLALPNVICVGGSWIMPAEAIANRDFARIEALARDAAALRKA